MYKITARETTAIVAAIPCVRIGVGSNTRFIERLSGIDQCRYLPYKKEAVSMFLQT